MDDNLRLSTLQKLKETYPDNWDAFKAKLSKIDPEKANAYLEGQAIELGLVQDDVRSDVDKGVDLVGETDLGMGSAFMRGAGEEVALGQIEELGGAMVRPFTDKKTADKFVEQQNLVNKGLEAEHPYAYGAGRVLGFAGGLGGKAAMKIGSKVVTKALGKKGTEKIIEYGVKGLTRYFPKVNWKAFGKLISRSMLEGAATLAPYEAVREGVQAVSEGESAGGVAKATGKGFLVGAGTGAFAGGVLPTVGGAGYIGVKAGGRAIKDISKGALKKLSKKSMQAKDILYQIDNIKDVSALRDQNVRSDVFAKEAKIINESKNRTIDSTNRQINNLKASEKKLVKKFREQEDLAFNSKVSSMESNADKVKLNATTKFIAEKEGARGRLRDYYGKESKRILNDPIGGGKKVKDLDVDVTETRNSLIKYLGDNRAIDTTTGDIIERSAYEMSKPKEALELFKLYEVLHGRSTVLRKDMGSHQALMNIEDSILHKQRLADVVNFSKGGTRHNVGTRDMFFKFAGAIEKTEGRFAPLNQTYHKGMGAIDDLVDVLGKDKGVEAFITRLAGKDSKVSLKQLKSLKGKISGEVDKAIDDTTNFINTARKAQKLKGKGMPNLTDEQIISKILQTSTKMEEVIKKGGDLTSLRGEIRNIFGSETANATRVEELLRNMSRLRANKTSYHGAVEELMEAIPGAPEAFLRTVSARVATRLFDSFKTGLLGFQSVIPQARFALLNWEVAASRAIDSMYKMSQGTVGSVLRLAPTQVQRFAESMGSRYAFVIWMKTKNGPEEIKRAVDRVQQHDAVAGQEDAVFSKQIQDKAKSNIQQQDFEKQLQEGR